MCACGEMACVCVWVCDKVSDDVMNKDERDERDEREREKEAERDGLEAVDFAIRSACDLQNVTHSKRPSKLSSGLIPTTAGSVSRM